MTAVLIALNIIAGLFLVAVVLLQAGKGADMGAAFGGANPAVFGPTGQGNVLQKVTAVTAIVFMGSSLALAVISSRQRSVFDGSGEAAPLAAPVAVPGTGGAVAPTAEGSAPAEGAAANAVAEGSAPPASGEAVPAGEGSAAAVPASPPASEAAASAPVPVPVVPPPRAAAPAAPAQPAGQ